MADMHKGDASFSRSFDLLDKLYESGLRHVVISPGSRSTPLVLAAAYHEGLSKYIAIDERSAAYMALGVAKATCRPAALICTSGTAVANYYPAVIEARKSSTPMILLTADRPPQDRISGAPQTINQIRIFHDYTVWFADAPEPDQSPENLEMFRTFPSLLWNYSIYAGGPAHLNLPFDKPLEPQIKSLEKFVSDNRTPGFVDSTDDELHGSGAHPVRVTAKEIAKTKVTETASASASAPVPASANPKGNPESHISTRAKDVFINYLGVSVKPLLIAGPTNHELPGLRDNIRALQALGVPVICCAGSQTGVDGITGYDAFLRNPDELQALKPDLILRTGLHPASKGLENLLENANGIPHFHFTSKDDFNDVFKNVSMSLPIDLLGNVALNLGTIGVDWTHRWGKASHIFQEFRDGLLNSETRFTDADVFKTALESLPDDLLITLSNSFPIRDYDLFRPTDRLSDTITNRGASGIDGVISTAVGACIGSGRNGMLFIGDVAALHDSNGLALSRQLGELTLMLILINNGGGTIFRMLPIASGFGELYTHYFETPHSTHFESIARAHGTGYSRAENSMELKKAITEMAEKPGIQVVECMTDASASLEIRKSLWNADYSG